MIGRWLAPQPGLQALYHFDGNSNDLSGNGINGTDTNITYSLANGKFGQGAGFNGLSSRINNIGGIPALAGRAAITWGGWINTNTVSMPPTTQRMAMAYGSRAALSVQVCQLLITANATQVLVGTVSGAQSYIASENSVPPTNIYRFAIGVYNSTDLKLFINGALVTVTSAPGGNTNSPGEGQNGLHIGHMGVTSEVDYNDWWSGAIGQSFFLNREVTASEIRKWYAWTRGKYL